MTTLATPLPHPRLNARRAAIDAENRFGDVSALECAAGQIEAALEKLEIQECGMVSDKALDAIGEAINALQIAAGSLRHVAGNL